MLSKGYLPPIFKMSVLWNVLPYYGLLHEWKELLESINEKTKTIWKEKSKALIYWGKEFRERIDIEDLNEEEICRSYLDLYSLYFKANTFYYDRICYILSALPYLLNENEVIIIKSNKGYNDCQDIYFSKEESVVEILPAFQCPSLKKTTLRSSNDSRILRFIKDLIGDKDTVIKKNHEELIAYSIYTSTLIVHYHDIFNLMNQI